MKSNPKIAVIGLGYVGLPLAVALAKHFTVVGFDINEERIKELQVGHDRTNEIDPQILRASSLRSTSNASELKGQDIYIVTVPTPVTHDNLPDLIPLQKASQTVGKALEKGAIVVYESTVYPGVTEDFCGPILEKISGLKAGQDFFLGYSPERINPGDKEHTIENITKVVSGQTKEVATLLKTIYGKINNNNIFVAKNIKTAEAAKVIENAQRDINIAFINEVATIVGKMNLSVYDVLDAAATKWNFLNFKPGLVGGHCIGVDPYYLAFAARKVNHEPEVILAGRRTNENMGNFVVQSLHNELTKMKGHNNSASKNASNPKENCRILILGLTFKEDIPDLRNSKVFDIVNGLKNFGHTVDIHDPVANPIEAQTYLQFPLLSSLEEAGDYDCIVGAVPHKSYFKFSTEIFHNLANSSCLVADLKNIWKDIELPSHVQYWSL